ncbi:xanthine dehydrogenase family protein molybdopterin-binding subunit [Sphingomonas sp.]|jgi:xanthine dehydrogenase YagR molybdenum-binding subunit|uniref:xanthine dehydrogenase family protein molybdopterin-binding subunit n=1 Tax=Sphingomonas sp. TaxID=28214 RepID=UPI002D7EC155|nr:xanthine dehydrogenase family protein molybdopterin-binding subunit [Sphingomonas sp.]HEU0043160.1 xanthine dehydrogenase family protein molybdopterin-binding subunit [Sphingomonas sp.]
MAELMMDAPYRPAALDRSGQGVLGKPLDRVDGPPKVTGAATYASEEAPAGTAYLSVVGTPVGSGRVTGIDTAAAEALPGVLAVVHGDTRMPAGGSNSQRLSAQGGDRIYHLGQPVAAVVAETAEVAREAARLVRVLVEATPGRFDADAETPQSDHGVGFLPTIAKGDLDAALAASMVTIDRTYRTPIHFPAALEPHASTVWWEGNRLTVRSSNQVIGAAKATIAKALGIDASRVRVLAPFVGGGFGGKTGVGPEVILAAIAAEKIGRPVKVSLPRAQSAYLVHHRSATVQRLRLGADAQGRIEAIAHESVAAQNDDGGFLEPVPFGTLPLYRGAVRHFRTDLVRLDLPATGAVRAPGEAVGSFAVEGAMDELAERLGIDPVELRRRNEPDVDPLSGKPFSTRRMVECYDEAARRFGWPDTVPAPASVREGDWLIGIGMAASLRGNFTVKAEARVRLEPDGRATVGCDMTDIGTGTYTILAQVAGEMLGLPVDRVEVRLGDTDLPPSAGSGGSFGAGSAGSAVVLACEDILVELGRRMNAAPDELEMKDGCVRAGGREATLAELTRGEPIVAHGKTGPGAESKRTSQASHGAQFAEVAVNAVTGEVRVRRMVGVFDIGRVLNEKTARSQIVGGMVWGIAYALTEHAVVDPRDGRFVTPDFGEYHVATSADVPAIEVRFIEEVDDHANPVGAKGVGELGISGAGAAVVNAVYNACGVRVYDLPITPDKLLAGLPEL